MKRPLILFILLLSSSLYSGILDLKINDISVASINTSSYRVTTDLTLPKNLHQILDESVIQVPVERFLLKGSIANGEIIENDILFSQIAADLNKNGSFKEKYSILYRNKKLYINKKLIFPYMGKNKYNNFTLFDNRYLIQRFTDKGMPVVLYETTPQNSEISIGIGSPGHPLSIKEIPNPSLQIMVASKVETFREKPAFRIEGKENYITFTNQQMFHDQADSWVAIVWTSFPLKEKNTIPEKIKKQCRLKT